MRVFAIFAVLVNATFSGRCIGAGEQQTSAEAEMIVDLFILWHFGG